MSQERSALEGTANSMMVLLTALWGFQQVTIKWIAADVSLVMQAALRSMVATALVLAWSGFKRRQLFERDGTLGAGIAAGLLFAFEFVFIYAELGHTNASRMSVFVYLAPPLTALGLHFFVAGERLGALQWGAVLVAFIGLVIAFAEGFFAGLNTWVGDLCGFAAALLWASTTVLPLASRVLGESGVCAVTPAVVASLACRSR